MKRSTKKKILTLSLVIALLAIVMVGGSLAWFTDTDEATNTFTIGSIEIVQNEIFDEKTAQLLPVVGDNPHVETDNYVQKNVTVTNTGKNPAYVQTLIAVPAPLDNAGVLKLWGGDYSASAWEHLDGDPAAEGNQPFYTNVAISGESVAYNVYVSRWNGILEATRTTTACLEYVFVDSNTGLNTYDDDGDDKSDRGYFVMNGSDITEINVLSDEINVYVVTQAVQQEGFASAEEALEAAFKDKHPWAE